MPPLLKRLLFYIPLPFVAPAALFFAFYLEGTGSLSSGLDALLYPFYLFMLPVLLAALFARLCNYGVLAWMGLSLLIVLIQLFLIIEILPPTVEGRPLGFAHVISREVSASDLQTCADDLRAKYHAGTLKTDANANAYLLDTPDVVTVDVTELPPALRSHFVRIAINHIGSGEQVMFYTTQRRGVICDDRKRVWTTEEYSFADGVHAYCCVRGG